MASFSSEDEGQTPAGHEDPVCLACPASSHYTAELLSKALTSPGASWVPSVPFSDAAATFSGCSSFMLVLQTLLRCPHPGSAWLALNGLPLVVLAGYKPSENRDSDCCDYGYQQEKALVA